MTQQIYVLIDPFNQPNSGVSKYTSLAAERILQLGLIPHVLRKQHIENLVEFTKRIATQINKLRSRIIMVEAPESMASSRLLSDWVPLHIRLHLSKELGGHLQGRPHDPDALKLEQHEISRANYVSAPSQAAIDASKILLDIPCNSFVYPNPSPNADIRDSSYEYDAIFIGRWQELKGIEYLTKLVKSHPDLKLAAITCDDVKLPKSLKRLKQTTQQEKNTAIRSSKSLIIPSLFETAGIVGLEAISLGRPVIAWSHLGICEYSNEPIVTPIKPWDLNALADAIRSTKSYTIDHYRNAIGQINLNFDSAIKHLIKGNPHAIVKSDAKGYRANVMRTLLDMRKRKMEFFKYNSFQRKLRKLQRDPFVFIKDSRLAKFIRKPADKPRLLPPKSTTKSRSNPISHEPRVIGEIIRKDNVNHFRLLDKKIVSKDLLSSLILCPPIEKDQLIIHLPFFGLPLKHKDFVGFRDRYLYYFQASTNNDLYDDSKYINYLDEFRDLHSRPFDRFRNIISRDPENLVPFVFRNSSNNISLIMIASATYKLDNIEDHTDEIDVLIISSENKYDITKNKYCFKRVIRYDNDIELINSLKTTIIENGKKEKNMLFPVYVREDIDIIENIDELNDRNIDGVIYMDQSYKQQRTDNFNDLIMNCHEHINSILLKEESYYKYKTLCDNGDIQNLLRQSLLGGLRYEVL